MMLGDTPPHIFKCYYGKAVTVMCQANIVNSTQNKFEPSFFFFFKKKMFTLICVGFSFSKYRLTDNTYLYYPPVPTPTPILTSPTPFPF